MSGLEMLFLLVVLGVVIAVVLGGYAKLSSNDGVSKRALKQRLASKTKELTIATTALNNISRTGNILEADVALEKINQMELKELES